LFRPTAISSPSTGRLDRPGGGALFADVHGPGLRMVVDMSQPESMRVSIAGGQSGHPLSSHYSDLLLEWGAGRYRSFRSTGAGRSDPAPGLEKTP
jgi:penicillin amidase